MVELGGSDLYSVNLTMGDNRDEKDEALANGDADTNVKCKSIYSYLWKFNSKYHYTHLNTHIFENTLLHTLYKCFFWQ